MQENLPVERLVRKALRSGEPSSRPGIRQLGIPEGAKRLEERKAQTEPAVWAIGCSAWFGSLESYVCSTDTMNSAYSS